MLLYLRNESQYRIDTIELIDGCYPRITYDVGAFSGNDGVRSPPPTEEYSVSELNIEPALWGIILILDRVCVDIQRRRFSWATASVGKILDDEGTEDPSHRTHYADDELYAYDDNIDELFNLAQHLIKISHSRTRSTRESDEEQSCLIRMLYCCILPKIKIYKKDWEKVDEAIKKQISYIKKIDQSIERDSEVLDKLYKVLCKQQNERLHHFQSIIADKKCTKKFITILSADLNKRTNQLKGQIDVNQSIVQQMKANIREDGATEERQKELKEAQHFSAYLNGILGSVLIVTCDTIKEALESKGFQHEDKDISVVEYLKSKEMSDRQKRTAKCQMEKKVRATSIFENLKRIKEDITEDKGEANATVPGPSGVRPTDVINDSHVPEYQTLSERVAAMVNNPEHPLGGQFQKFTTYVREYCDEILEFPASSSEKQKKSGKLQNGYLLVDNNCSLQEDYLTPLEKLCEQIKKHCDYMARLFLEQFNSSSEVLKCKLQLSYEDNFYKEVEKDITKVYDMAYKQQKEKMIQDLELLATYPIKCLDLGMKDEWWLELFEVRRQATIARRRSLGSPGTRNILSSSSSSSRSSGSEKYTEVLPDEHPSTHVPSKQPKRSSSRIRSSLIKFIRRKSREMTEAEVDVPDETRKSTHTCYDNYQADTRFAAHKMSGTIEPCMNNNEHTSSMDLTKKAVSMNGTCKHGSEETNDEAPQNEKKLLKFAQYFGPSLDCLKDISEVSSVFEKLKCLTKSLTKVTDAVHELRKQVLERVDEDNEFSLAITADDLLPLMVLIMLQMDSTIAASIVVELKMMQDLIPRFLSIGCYGWALVEYDMASQVLQSLCAQFDWSCSFNTSP